MKIEHKKYIRTYNFYQWTDDGIGYANSDTYTVSNGFWDGVESISIPNELQGKNLKLSCRLVDFTASGLNNIVVPSDASKHKIYYHNGIYCPNSTIVHNIPYNIGILKIENNLVFFNQPKTSFICKLQNYDNPLPTGKFTDRKHGSANITMFYTYQLEEVT